MSNTTKSWAKSILDSYDSSLSRLTQRYVSNINSIDEEYDLKKREIEKTAQKRKNSADASSKIALSNVKSSLLQKGLSKSGDSVQAELDNNLQRMSAMSDIESDAQEAKTQNEAERSKAKNSAFVSYITSVGNVEQARDEAYAKQLNLDREYEAERDDEKYDRFADNRDYEAAREDEKYDRFADNRDYEAAREDEKYDRFADNRDYEAAREDEKYDRFADNRDYEAEQEDEKYDRYSDSLKEEGSNESTTGSTTTTEKIVPKYNAKTFVDKIVSTYLGKYGESEKTKNTIKHSLKIVIDDTSLDYSYRYQVKVYAKALGYY